MSCTYLFTRPVTGAPVALGVAVAAQAPQVLQHVPPATLTGENVIDLGRERPALDAQEAVTLERPRPEPTPSAG